MDGAVTHIGVQKGLIREAWLPTSNPWAVDAVMVGEEIGSDRAVRHMAKDHPKVAKGMLVAMIAIRGLAVASNIHQIRIAQRSRQ